MPLLKAQDGADICYSDQGTGPAVLFLHGWLMSHRVWHGQLPLASTMRVITMDLRGHGESAAPDFSYAACLDNIEELLDVLQIEKVIIAGWSMGSQLALLAAARLQTRISGLILVSGTPRFCSDADYPAGLPAMEARGMAITIKRDYRGAAGRFFSSMFSAEEAASLDLRETAAKATAPLPPLPIALTALQELIDTDLRGLLREITLPTFLIHGGQDRICPCEAALFMAGQLPAASSEIFPAAGHAPFLAAPAPFNRGVTAFVRTVHG